MVKYRYSGYGIPEIAKGDNLSSSEEVIAEALRDNNIYLYKGYCYDKETGLYYLNSRYYDPEVGRFISIDDIAYLDPESINGLNLYAYCRNNPIMYYDSDGRSPKWWQWMLFGIGAALVVAAAVVVSIATFGTGAAFACMAGAIAVGAAKGALIGAAIGTVVGIGGGAIIGAVIGGAKAMVSHFKDHGVKMGFKNPMKYTKAANSVIKGGQYYAQKNAFIAAFEAKKVFFVGVNEGIKITTFGIRTLKAWELLLLGIL